MMHNVLQIQHDSLEEMFRVVDSGATEENFGKENKTSELNDAPGRLLLAFFFFFFGYSHNMTLRLCINNVCTAFKVFRRRIVRN